MRLLNARTLQFKEVQGLRGMPKYAILSHTWADTEVVYADLIASPQLARQRPEFAKVKLATQQALKDGLDYIWIDTCNMDKSSSAELSETINSMFMLYKNAEVCYAYLVDVAEPPPAGWNDDGHNDDAWTNAFASARWFTRGWTLQELLAPRNVVFYSSDWRRIGTKRELCQTIARNTGISSAILLGSDPGTTLVAERMSWAANRKTSRVEDQAYCLLGLFDINMPLLYGEGERAFVRLQHEIIKTTNDRSIFLWTAAEASCTTFRNMFARSPAEFASFNDYDLSACYGRFDLTQSGLEIDMPLLEVPGAEDPEFFGVVIDAGQGFHCICLRQIGENEYLRIDADRIFPILNPDYNQFASENPRLRPHWITIPNKLSNFSGRSYMDLRLGGFHVEYHPVELQISSVEPSYAWVAGTNTLEMDLSKDLRPLEDAETGWKIVFSEISHSHTSFTVDLMEFLRYPGQWRMESSSNEKYGYVVTMSQRFIGDKKMNVVRVQYQIKDEGGMKISSEKNPLPGRYISYRNASEEDHAKMIATWAREREQKEVKSIESSRVGEEELSQPEDKDDNAVGRTDEIDDQPNSAPESSKSTDMVPEQV
ncbi:heterokaryon incompatibility protein-domain-containing protein [Stachybotrys elegans]|uniref:Heterokaryon incompatibility protein-domain-containing protein n=1 Tax=Stachybotrys elegans TaxID=80388 RepID=A0A8K0T0H3_9HYPO|nr:heterokaryon incompatibility protein-domain-containing protein [Stachybotrys elegans]